MMSKFQQTVDEWRESRKATISCLRNRAEKLHHSHRINAKSEHTSAVTSLFGSLIGLSGVLLTPVSGGLSLAAAGVSTLAAGGSWLNKSNANIQDEKIRKEVENYIKRVIDEDNAASERLNSISQILEFLEHQQVEMQIGDILVRIKKITVTKMNLSVREIKSNALQCNLQQGNATMSVSGSNLEKQFANLKAAVKRAEQEARRIRITETIISGTKTIQEVVSTAKSLNQVTQTAKSLATAKQAVDLTLQASQSVAKSTATFVCVAKGADGVVKTAGIISSATKSANVAVNILNSSGQTASFAARVTDVAKVGTSISTTTKGTGTTIKAVKGVKESSRTVKTVTQVATDSDKAIRTTRITTNATKMSKVSETVTKTASISKVAFAINAVAIPFDIYNLMITSDNLYKSFKDVKLIQGMADSLEQQMNDIPKVIEVRYESISKLHVQLCKVYEDHRIDEIYKYLRLLHTKLDFDIPLRY